MEKIKTIFISIALLLCCTPICGQEFTSGSLYYRITSSKDKTVGVCQPWGVGVSYSGSISIPETVTYNDEVFNVTSIEFNAFVGSSRLISVDIPNSITIIEGNAFSGCSGLTSISIPNSVTTIEGSAFSKCRGLTSITIPESVISINY